MKFSKRKQTNLDVGLAGPRPARCKLPKAYLMDLCARLRAHGIGCWAGQELIGYNATLIGRYQRDMGCPPMTPTEMTRILIDKLPDDLKAECARVKTKSTVAHQAAENRKLAIPSRQTHHLIDDDADAGQDGSADGRGAPERIVEAAE